MLRFRCRDCRRTFSTQTFRQDYRDRRPEVNERLFESLVGAELTMQWATIDPAGPFANLAARSNGLQIRIGKS